MKPFSSTHFTYLLLRILRFHLILVITCMNTLDRKQNKRISKKDEERSSQQKVIIFYDWEKNEYTVMSRVYQQMYVCLCMYYDVYRNMVKKPTFSLLSRVFLCTARLFNVNILQCTHERATKQRRKGGKHYCSKEEGKIFIIHDL